MKKVWLVIGLVATCAGVVGAARADELVMRDGSVRWGTVVARNATQVQFRMEREGMMTVVVVPLGQIARIVMGAQPPVAVAASGPGTMPGIMPATVPYSGGAGGIAGVATRAGAVVPAATAPAAVPIADGGAAVPSASEAELAAFESRGFLSELMAASVGKGPDDVRRLPAADRELWEAAVAADKAGKRAKTLEALRGLEAAMQDLPEGLGRLEGIARRQRAEGFGTWMARVHWDLINGKYSTGQFDLNDVRGPERRPLIAILRKATSAAMEPLKPYFPPVDEKTGLPAAFKPAQLAGVTVSNALELKEKSLFAAAVILAQLKLEPEMPGVDKALFAQQLSNVNRVLGRARDLEGLAKAALVRAEQEKRAAEEKAKRDAAIAAQRAATRPK